MNKKLEFILDELIKNYLKVREPISSSSLKKMSNLSISPSTIRGYFQSLEEIGMVKKEHFASGSYPTKKAMKYFWERYFPKDISLSLEELEKKAYIYNVAIHIKMFENELLKYVHNYNNKFLILEFENKEIVFRYSKELYNFFKSMQNYYSYDLSLMLSRYNLDFLKEKFKIFQKEFTFNKKLLYNNFSEVNLDNLTTFDGENFIVKTFSYVEGNKKIELIFIGDIYSNFLAFKGGENE